MRKIRQVVPTVEHASPIGTNQKVRCAVRRVIAAHSAAALGAGMLMSGVAHAQAVSGSIYGQAPAAPGETVVVSSSATGVSRTVAVGSDGTYQVNTLPVGTYTVTLMRDGKVVSRRRDEVVTSAGGTGVDFVAAAALATVTVTATSLPNIDVKSVTSGTVIDASQLAKLPIVQNAENIALLAPSTTSGSGYFKGPTGASNLVSFDGSSVSENAYYVNGYNTGEPYKNLGGFALPYGAIQEQQTLTGGYSAKYGRSDGGVISQIGKRGTNDWHFGGQIEYEPDALRASPEDVYYGNPKIPANTPYVNYAIADPTEPGTLRIARGLETASETRYSAYIGGPIIPSKLFFFLAPEETKDSWVNLQDSQWPSSSAYTKNEDRTFKLYGKIDWNINSWNILDFTYLRDDWMGGDQANNVGAGGTYAFDYTTRKVGAYTTGNDIWRDNSDFYIGHFTSFITDSLTLNVLYGTATFKNPVTYANTSPLPFISQSNYEELGGVPLTTPISNSQTNEQWYLPDASNHTHGLRVDLEYKLFSHSLMAGIDDMTYSSHDQGISQFNPNDPTDNYFWRYFPGGIVRQYQIGWATSMRTIQKAFYLQDDWAVTDRILLQIGVRNEHYTNENDLGEAFVDEKNQWAPRLGVAWNVNGDSSFKLYANAGRYYLALPDNAAERAANRSTYLETWYNYTGIDANGIPTGLTQVRPTYSPDGETGGPKDPEQVAARNLKPEYVNEFIVGFDRRLGEHWTYGAKGTWRDLKTAIDDECSPGQIAAKMTKMGLNPGDYYNSLYGANYCRLINPGQVNDMLVVPDAGGKGVIVPMTQQDWGYKEGVKRRILSVDFYLEHPFNGIWQGRVDYTYTHGYGNTEGQVRSDFGQADISKTEDWDSWQLMDGQEGELLNTRRHQIKVRGFYQITRQFGASATLLAQSGVPEECLGYYGPGASASDPAPGYYAPGGTGDPTGYNSGGSGNYHWCYGQKVPPGDAGHTPWTFPLNLGLTYSPNFADQRLKFGIDVLNVFNQQEPVQTDPVGTSAYDGDANTLYVNNTYQQGIYWEPPRTTRLTVSFDY